MLSLHSLLRIYGFDPAKVRSMRHVVRPHEYPRLLESLRGDRSGFEVYASHQSARTEQMVVRYEDGATTHLAMFVALSDRRVMFVGLYRIVGLKRNVPSLFIPIAEKVYENLEVLYTLEREPTLEKYVGRLFIDWGESDRAWVQKQDKSITAIESPPDPPFPGLRRFTVRVASVPNPSPFLAPAPGTSTRCLHSH